MIDTLVKIKVDMRDGFRFLADIDVENIADPRFTTNKHLAKKFSFSEKEVVISGIHRKKADGFFPQINYCW